MEELTIIGQDGKIRVCLSGKEIQGVTAYEVKSSTAGTAELTLKVIVRINALEFRNQVTDDLRGNLGKNT